MEPMEKGVFAAGLAKGTSTQPQGGPFLNHFLAGEWRETVYEPSEKQLLEISAILSSAIQERWNEAQLGSGLGDDIRAGLAAAVLLEASLDRSSPWQFREVVDLSDSDAMRTDFRADLPNESKLS